MVTCVKLAQFAKAPSPILVTEAGMAMLVKPDWENAKLPILSSWLPLSKVTLARLEVPWKALNSILVTEAGMAMLVKPDH